MKKIINALKTGIGAVISFLNKIQISTTLNRVKNNLLNSKIGAVLKSHAFQVILIWLAVVVAVIQVVFGVLIYGYQSEMKATQIAARIIPYPVAVANQSFITYNEYLQEKTYIHHFYAATQQSNIDYDAIDKEIIDQLVDNELILFQAYKNRISVSDKEVDESLNQIIEQNGGKENVNKVLSELYGINLDQFKKLVRTQLIREKINNELIMRIDVRHILVRVEKDAAQDKVDAAKAKIDGMKKEIEGGLDFAEAAKKYSEDTGSAENGGKLDPFAEGEMVSEFSKAAFETPVGNISEPIRTEFGWHVIKVEGKTGKIQKSFNDWLSQIEKRSLIVKLLKI